jgi:hypothetical protein
MLYMKNTADDWIGCDVCNAWFHVSCTSLRADTFIEMAGVKSSIWLCEVCMPNLMKYVAVSSSQANDVATLDAVEERLTAICDRFDAATVSAADAQDRHCSNLRELESRLSLAAQGVEKVSSSLLDGSYVNQGGVPEKAFGEGAQKDVQHHHGRFANRNRLIITNMPVRAESRLIDDILALSWAIGFDLQYGDIDHCNQLTSNHPSNAAPVFVRFVSRWRREEFYSCYLHYVNKKPLQIATVFRQYKDSLGRIYVSEHLTPHDNLVYKGAKNLKKSGLIMKVSTRKGCVCIVSLDGKEKLVENLDELRRMTSVLENFTPTTADLSLYVDAEEDIRL